MRTQLLYCLAAGAVLARGLTSAKAACALRPRGRTAGGRTVTADLAMREPEILREPRKASVVSEFDCARAAPALRSLEVKPVPQYQCWNPSCA